MPFRSGSLELVLADDGLVAPPPVEPDIVPDDPDVEGVLALGELLDVEPDVLGALLDVEPDVLGALLDVEPDALGALAAGALLDAEPDAPAPTDELLAPLLVLPLAPLLVLGDAA